MLSRFSTEIFRLGLRSLRLHKLRSLLTALGIIFGVGAVICMLSISEGASADELRLIRMLGTQNIIVRSIKPQPGSRVSEERTRMLAYGITEADYDVICETIPHVLRAVPLREVAFEVSKGPRRCAAIVAGADWRFFATINVPRAAGRFLTAEHDRARLKVCVIGDDIRKELFAYEDPIGQVITAHNVGSGPVPYEVVGVLARVSAAGRPARGIGGRDLNRDVFIPLSTADARYGAITILVTSGARELSRVEYSDIYVQVDEMDHVLAVSEMIARVMEKSHEEQDYKIYVPLARLQLAEREKVNRQITLGCIAGVSLLVGGIGIMNIMLASVTERTREIGIRRALGAKQRHVIAQFLVETVVLSTTGGLLGIALGRLGAWGINQSVGWPTIVHFWTVWVSFGLSVLIGVFFGMYPAIAAAKLDPIEALRHE